MLFQGFEQGREEVFFARKHAFDVEIAANGNFAKSFFNASGVANDKNFRAAIDDIGGH